VNADLEAYIGALGVMFENVQEMVSDGKGSPSWSQIFDSDNAPTDALGWLAQWVGVDLDRRSSFEADDVYWSRQRAKIKAHLGFERGSLGAIRAAAQLWLTGSKTVFIQERDGTAYTLTVITRTAETPDPDAVLRELLKQKPAGIILNYVVAAGRTFVETTALGRTFAGSTTAWPTFDNRRGA
jgi:hypothetical protein